MYMTSLLFLNHYLVWHYTVALWLIAHIWKNILWFTVHFFSIPLLLKSLFAPWKRMTETTGGRFDFEAIAGVIVIGFFSRLVGALVRSFIVILGLLSLALEIISLPLVYLFWLTAPVLIVGLFIWGVLLLLY
jgi:hypothetical protein